MKILKPRLSYKPYRQNIGIVKIYTKKARLFIGLFAVLGLSAFILLGLSSKEPKKTSAYSAQLTYTELGTHPQANAQSTVAGKTIKSLEIYNGKLIAGYGDYDINTGPIAINPYDLNSDSFDGVAISSPTEEIRNMRILNGKLYVPTVDAKNMDPGGYTMANGNSWSNVLPAGVNTPVNATHVYDVAYYNGSLYLSGSNWNSDAVIWSSSDDGATWTVAKSTTSTGAKSGFERFYWLAVLDNKLYAQALSVTPTAPLMYYDGSTWQEGTTDQIAPADSKVVVFNDKIITTRYGLSSFDGVSLTTLMSNKTIQDLYVGDDGFLYVLFTDHTLQRTDDLNDWQTLGITDANASAIAEHDGYIYWYIGF